MPSFVCLRADKPGFGCQHHGVCWKIFPIGKLSCVPAGPDAPTIAGLLLRCRAHGLRAPLALTTCRAGAAAGPAATCPGYTRYPRPSRESSRLFIGLVIGKPKLRAGSV